MFFGNNLPKRKESILLDNFTFLPPYLISGFPLSASTKTSRATAP